MVATPAHSKKQNKNRGFRGRERTKRSLSEFHCFFGPLVVFKLFLLAPLSRTNRNSPIGIFRIKYIAFHRPLAVQLLKKVGMLEFIFRVKIKNILTRLSYVEIFALEWRRHRRTFLSPPPLPTGAWIRTF